MPGSEDDEYEVERILSDKLVDGCTFYLVKWKGYGDEECTWEPGASFNLPESIKIWEEQKANGDVLPDEFLIRLEERMDHFQNGSTGSTNADSPVEDSHANIETVVMPRTDQQVISSRFAEKRTKHRKGVARRKEPLKLPKVRVSGKSITARPARDSRKFAEDEPRPVDNQTQTPVFRTGQKFRNLQHMNNARKKARNELAPDLPAHLLKSAADFKTGPDTAHILPPFHVVATRTADSPLFVPEPADGSSIEALSPITIEKFPSPSSFIEGTKDIGKDIGILTPTNIKPSLHDSTSPRSAKNEDNFLDEARRIRSWKGRDIMCDFRMGEKIGDATLSYVPFDSYGCRLLSLNSTRMPLLDFGERITITELERVIGQNKCPDAIGLIDPHFDQQRRFGVVTTYLENEDVAALSRQPNININLVMYSCNAKSWKTLGTRSGRNGQARLHVAFYQTEFQRGHNEVFPKNMEVTEQPAAFESLSASLILASTNPTQQSPTVSPSIESIGSPANLRTKHLVTAHPSDSGQTKAGNSVTDSQSDMATMTPRSRSRHLSNDRHTNAEIEIDLSKTSQSSHTRHTIESSKEDNVLKFRELTRPMKYNPELKLDRSKSHFFISFAKTYPRQARVLQTWLESMVPPSNVYLDSERHGWTRFQEKAGTVISVLLFHDSQVNFFRFLGLDEVLMSELSICFVANFEQNLTVKSLAHTTKFTRIFAKATIYLLTESVITQHLDDALSAVKYFNQSKKADYRIMMRPNIQDWLLNYAAHEPDKSRRDKCLDLLVLVRNLNPWSPEPLDSPNDMSEIKDAEQIRYVLSCNSISDYQDTPLCVESATTAMFPSPKAPVTSVQKRDRILREYFYAYTAVHAKDARRCIAFVTPQDLEIIMKENKAKTISGTLECGHVHFWDIQKFAARFR